MVASNFCLRKEKCKLAASHPDRTCLAPPRDFPNGPELLATGGRSVRRCTQSNFRRLSSVGSLSVALRWTSCPKPQMLDSRGLVGA